MSVPRPTAAALAAICLLRCGGAARMPEPVRPEAVSSITSICFADPLPEAPDASTRARVLADTRRLDGREAPWIRALMTHESAGVADAVSPTGCAGPLAIASCPGCTPCCVGDARDGASRVYDRCDWERENGYLCDPRRDPRFREDFSVDFAKRKIRALETRVANTVPRDFSFTVALAVAWNAGASSVTDFPHGLTSATAAAERLRLFAVEPYRSWSDEDRWNKLVEVYDYALWLEALHRSWESPTTPRGPATPHATAPGVRCFDVSAGGFVAAPRRAGDYRRVSILRLRFGRYRPDWVEVQ